jgi:hypothetical protein
MARGHIHCSLHGKRKIKRVRRNIVLQLSYKDGDKSKQTNSFGLGDLPAAIVVLELAVPKAESGTRLLTRG